MEFWYLLGLTESGNLASGVHAEFILHMLIIDTEQWVSHFMLALCIFNIIPVLGLEGRKSIASGIQNK